MEIKKQTAVQWLQEAMSNKLISEIGPYFLDLFEQAKAMENEQIIDACNYGDFEELGEQYYNENYGN